MYSCFSTIRTLRFRANRRAVQTQDELERTKTACDPPCRPACRLLRPPRRLEEVYLVYTAEKNRALTLRLHYTLFACWAVAALTTGVRVAGALSHGDMPALPQLAFVLLAQLANLGYQLAALPRLRSVARQDQLQQERTKAWLHVLLDVGVMLCLILSEPAAPAAPAPVAAMVLTSFVAVLDTASQGSGKGKLGTHELWGSASVALARPLPRLPLHWTLPFTRIRSAWTRCCACTLSSGSASSSLSQTATCTRRHTA